jgi:hypothetical protein
MLSKWREDSISVFISLMGETLRLRLVGSIAEVSPREFMIAESPARIHGDEVIVRLTVRFDSANDFDYGDLRDAPENLKGEWQGIAVSLLRFTIPEGALALMELGPECAHNRP